MFDEFTDVGVSSQGGDTTIRGEYLANIFTIFYELIGVGVPEQGEDKALRVGSLTNFFACLMHWWT